MTKPKPQRLGSVSARAIRGPRDDGRWYWRAEWTRAVAEGASRSLWAGWATEHEVQVEVARLLAAGQDRPRQVEEAPAWTGLRTVDELLRAYLYHCEHERPELRERTVEAMRERVRAWRRCGSEAARIDRLPRGGTSELRASALKVYAPMSARVMLQHLAAAWRWARLRGYVPDQELTIAQVPVPKKVRPVMSFGDAVELAHQQTRPERRVMLLLLAHLGARRGEIATLTWDRVDLDGGWLVLDGKTGPRRAPLSVELAAEIGALPRTSQWVLGVTPEATMSAIKRLLPGGAHALRRGAVDRLAHAGVDVATAAALLGHSAEMMLTTYRQVTDADLRRAVDIGTPGQVIPLEGRRRR